MKYIVTGGAGFIGSHVADALVSEGHEVHVVDNLMTGKREHINPHATWHNVDIRDLTQLVPLCAGADGVFHLAALARIQPSFQNPNLYVDVNVLGTRNVLIAAREARVRRVVFSGSSSVYGNVAPLPLNEDAHLAAQAAHPYGSTKRMGEMLMRDLGSATGGPETVCLRYFNVYGPRQTTTADGPYATVIGIFLDCATRGAPLPIVPDGHQRRDFTWVGDVVRANLLAMRAANVGAGEICNVGCGKNYSMWEVARLVLEAPEASPEALLTSGRCAWGPIRRGEVHETRADTARARELIGWEATVHLAEGMRITKEATTHAVI